MASRSSTGNRYGAMLAMMESGKLSPEKLVGEKISLAQSIDALMNMDRFTVAGATVVTEF